MTTLPASYDAWRLSGPYDDQIEIGTEDGQPCMRVHDPDEDAPRGYRPMPCKGVMIADDDSEWPGVTCDTCGEEAA